ncbi:MAG: toll/interleukin-1 receptor domain-containing protein [Pseudomonadota bacterium]
MADSETAPRRYRAFLSYAHADKATGRWLHRKLEHYRVPKRLRREHGAPKRLAPIFRDKEELPAGGSLPDRLTEALDASDHLIVLCSPKAAASEWVNREIATFKRQGKADRIIPVIAEGDAQQAFPAALVFEVDADLQPTGMVDPKQGLGADLRAEADGKKDGILKVVAGLLGVGFDEIRRREEQAARRRAAFAYSLAASFAALSVGAIAALIWALDSNQKLTQAFNGLVDAVADRNLDVVSTQQQGRMTSGEAEKLLRENQALLDAAYALAPDDRRFRAQKATSDLLFSRHLNAIGRGDEAQDAADQAASMLAPFEKDNAAARGLLGMMAAARGDDHMVASEYALAAQKYEEAVQSTRQLYDEDATNPLYRVQLSGLLAKLASAQLALDDEVSSRAHLEESLALVKDVLELEDVEGTDYGGTELASMVAAQLGDVLIAQEAIEDGIEAYTTAVEFARSWRTEDLGDMRRTQALLAALGAKARGHMALGDNGAASVAAEEGVGLLRELVEWDAENPEFARRLADGLELLIHIRIQNEETDGAIQVAEERVSVRRSLLRGADESIVALEALAQSLSTLAYLREAKGEADTAVEIHRERLDIVRRLLEKDPSNGDRQWEVSSSLMYLGDLLSDLERWDEAYPLQVESYDIAHAAALNSPGDPDFEYQVALRLWRLALQGDVAWDDVAAAWEALEARGLLSDEDRAFVAQARGYADAERDNAQADQ